MFLANDQWPKNENENQLSTECEIRKGSIINTNCNIITTYPTAADDEAEAKSAAAKAKEVGAAAEQSAINSEGNLLQSSNETTSIQSGTNSDRQTSANDSTDPQAYFSKPINLLKDQPKTAITTSNFNPTHANDAFNISLKETANQQPKNIHCKDTKEQGVVELIGMIKSGLYPKIMSENITTDYATLKREAADADSNTDTTTTTTTATTNNGVGIGGMNIAMGVGVGVGMGMGVGVGANSGENNNREYLETLLNAPFSEMYNNTNSNTNSNSLPNPITNSNLNVTSSLPSSLLRPTKSVIKLEPQQSPQSQLQSTQISTGNNGSHNTTNPLQAEYNNGSSSVGGCVGNIPKGSGSLTANQFLSSMGIRTTSSGGITAVPTGDANLKANSQTATFGGIFEASAAAQANRLSSDSIADNNSEDGNGQAKIVLVCEPNSHPFQTRTILFLPNVEVKVGRLIAKAKASESNAIFDCKVLSRTHAVLWYSDDGKFWVKDTKSSNGTFINENKLGTEPAELHFGDIVKFGVDVLENSRKEVHGCIIACVKLYLPDGREAISIETPSRQQLSGEVRITYEELHRLHLFLQEAAQREKALKSKLNNLLNIIDSTRKNSMLVWQALLNEDQLLHRIHTLEKKLQFMEKNTPESSLKTEVLKLIDEKNSYQLTAKEALRKVYQERCDAMQMLAKMETAYQTSENEVKLLREQIQISKNSMQDLNQCLQNLQEEYDQYKVNMEHAQQEAKEIEERKFGDLLKQLQHSEDEIKKLKEKVTSIFGGAPPPKRMNNDDDEEEEEEEDDDEEKEVRKVDKSAKETEKTDGGNFVSEESFLRAERRAIAKLDAALADMDLGDDLDEDVENYSIDGNLVPPLQLSDYVPDMKEATDSTSPVNKEQTKSNASVASKMLNLLQNSDLNKKDGSFDIIAAICNDDSDSSDENDTEKDSPPPVARTKTGASAGACADFELNKLILPDDSSNSIEYEQKCERLSGKLKDVHKNLSRLELEIAKETSDTEKTIATRDDGSALIEDDSDDDDDDDDVDDGVDDATAAAANGDSNSNDDYNNKIRKRNSSIFSKNHRIYNSLKGSVSILRDAYNDLADIVQKKTTLVDIPKQGPVTKLVTPETLKLPGQSSADDDSDSDTDSEVSNSEATVCHETARRIMAKPAANDEKHQEQKQKQQRQQQQQHDNQQEEMTLSTEQTLEMLQMECDQLRDKINELSQLKQDKEQLERWLNEQFVLNSQNNAANVNEFTHNVNNVEEQPSSSAPYHQLVNCGVNTTPNLSLNINEVATNTSFNLNDAATGSDNIDANTIHNFMDSFQREVDEELRAMNNSDVEREEELIAYKDHLRKTQMDNLHLRNEIAELRTRVESKEHSAILRTLIPYFVVMLAILVYFMKLYF